MIKAKDNPIRVDRLLTIRFRPQGESWSAMLTRLERMNYRGAVVGLNGTGKSTLLENLGTHLEHLGYVVHSFVFRLDDATHRRDASKFSAVPFGRHDFILLDGADHLRRQQWRRLRRSTTNAAGWVITSHKTGYLPTWVSTTTTSRLLQDILRELLGDQSTAFDDLAIELHDRHHGNLRDVLRELYDRFATENLSLCDIRRGHRPREDDGGLLGRT